MPRHAPALALAAISLPALAPGAGAQTGFIDNVHIIDVRAGQVVEDRAVLVRAGRIAAILDAGATVPEGADVMDAGGMYLMPGLIDSHVHFISPEVYGPAMLANGVVLVRDMGSATETILPIRDALNAGERVGPRMIASGAIVDGDPPVWPFSEACDSPEAARAAVDRLADAGVDFVKVYSRLDRETFLAAVDQARERGLMAAGHVPESVSIEEAAEAGQRTAEHMMGVPSVVLPPMDEAQNTRIGARDRWELIPGADEAAIEAGLAELAELGIVHCPTLVVYEGIARADDEDRSEGELMAYTPEAMLSFWEQPGYKGYARALDTRLPIMVEFAGRMHRAGVPMIVGTDLANPWVFPGFAVHREMQLLAEGGIPPADVLRMATITPAELFGVDDRFGSIERGREASFVLLAANPLEDLAALGRIEGVWLAGERHDRAALDGLLADARRAARGEVDEDGPEFADGVGVEGEPVREGRVSFTFGQWEAGHESFLLTRGDDGYTLYAEFRPLGGMQKPSLSVYRLGPDMQVRSASYRELADDPIETVYEVRDGLVVATRGDETQEFEVPEGGIVTGPNNVADVIVNHALDLEPGESTTYQSVAFGISGWRVRSLPIEVVRLDDETVDVGGETIQARVHESTFSIDAGQFTTRVWTDDDGVLVRGVMTMPFGELLMELDAGGD